MAKLTNPKMHVTLDDGTEHDVQTINIDLVRWDMNRTKHGWPASTDAPILWSNYVVWQAMTRTNLIPRWSFDEFCVHVVDLIPDEDGETPVDPTPEEAGPG